MVPEYIDDNDIDAHRLTFGDLKIYTGKYIKNAWGVDIEQVNNDYPPGVL